MIPRAATTPLRYAVVWLISTYLGFLLLGQVDQINNTWQLSVAVVGFCAAFAVGYLLQVRAHPWPTGQSLVAKDPSTSTVKILVFLGALHYLAYGVAYLQEFGLARPSVILQSLTNPGSAYLAKFDVFARQEALGSSNIATRILTVAAPLAAPLIPFLVVYWRKLTPDLRILGLIGIGSYVCFYLTIGTLAGLGSSVIFAGASLLVVLGQRRQARTRRRKGILALGLLFVLAFVSYMSYNQGARLTETGLTADQRFAPNPIVEAVTNRSFAQGVAVTVFYPTHGYQGLAYNLETPFEWTRGLGSSKALDSYVAQYGLSDSVAQDTYPARTEARTGWPADVYWATVYPWLASDLSWFGVPLVMLALGWWTARWWREAVVDGDPLALLLFAQAALSIAFIPANNQIGLSRPYLITALALLGCYALRQITRSLSRGATSGAADPAARGHVCGVPEVEDGAVVDGVGDRLDGTSSAGRDP